DIQIERARDNQHGFGSLGEPRHNAICVSQQFVAQGVPPIFRSAKQLAQFLFLTGGVSTLCRLNLDLRVQHHALNLFRRRRVNDLDFEMEQRSQATLGSFDTGNLEIKIRHEGNDEIRMTNDELMKTERWNCRASVSVPNAFGIHSRNGCEPTAGLSNALQ